jgi:hypothetical protein
MKRKRDDGAVAQETICRIRESYQTRSNYNTGGSAAANGIDPKIARPGACPEGVRYWCAQLRAALIGGL